MGLITGRWLVEYGDALYLEIVEDLSLDPVAWQSALGTGTYAEKLQRDFEAMSAVPDQG